MRRSEAAILGITLVSLLFGIGPAFSENVFQITFGGKGKPQTETKYVWIEPSKIPPEDFEFSGSPRTYEFWYGETPVHRDGDAQKIGSVGSESVMDCGVDQSALYAEGETPSRLRCIWIRGLPTGVPNFIAVRAIDAQGRRSEILDTPDGKSWPLAVQFSVMPHTKNVLYAHIDQPSDSQARQEAGRTGSGSASGNATPLASSEKLSPSASKESEDGDDDDDDEPSTRTSLPINATSSTPGSAISSGANSGSGYVPSSANSSSSNSDDSPLLTDNSDADESTSDAIQSENGQPLSEEEITAQLEKKFSLPRPNPVRTGSRVTVLVEGGYHNVEIRIFDVQGRLLFSQISEFLPAFTWDARVAPGIYFIQFLVNDHRFRISRKFTVVN